MAVMFEVYYSRPADQAKEAGLTELIVGLGGRFDFREETGRTERGGVCLTYEYDSWDVAASVADALRQQGEHVEGPVDYGP